MLPAPPSDLSRPARDFVSPVDTTLQADLSVGEALALLRRRKPEHGVIYFYVVDSDNRLLGVVPTRSLLLSSPATPVRDLMNTAVVKVHDDFTLEEVLEAFALHRLLALPVVDHDDHLLGFIDVRLYAEEAVDLAQAHRADHLFQIIGLSVERARQGSAVAGFKVRMPWLMCNLASGITCAIIGAVFSDVLEAVVLLAMFFPLVLTLSESVSMQAMTIGLQFMQGPRVAWKLVRKRLNVEWKTAAMLGLAGGLLVAVASVFFPNAGPMHPAPVLAVSILVSMTISAIVGLGMPALLHASRLDPRVAAGPVVLMIADVLTTAAYLGLATSMLL